MIVHSLGKAIEWFLENLKVLEYLKNHENSDYEPRSAWYLIANF